MAKAKIPGGAYLVNRVWTDAEGKAIPHDVLVQYGILTDPTPIEVERAQTAALHARSGGDIPAPVQELKGKKGKGRAEVVEDTPAEE